MSKIVLGIIGNGRKDLLDQTVKSALEHLKCDFYEYIMVNDTGNQEYSDLLNKEYSNNWKVINHESNQGLSGSIRSLWAKAIDLEADYVFHLEEDFLFNVDIDIDTMKNILSNTNISQVALKRQPWNEHEAASGGLLEQYSNLLIPNYCDNGVKYMTHRILFTLNPCLYPRWVMDLGWQQGWGEREYTDMLFSNPNIVGAYLGDTFDPPTVHHIGHYRGPNWFL